MPLTQLHTYTPRTPLGVLDEEIEAIIAAINQNETDIAAHTHELSALDATGVTAGYVLEAQGDGTADWVAHVAPAHTHELDDLDATGITDGYVPYADSGGVVWAAAPSGGGGGGSTVLNTDTSATTINNTTTETTIYSYTIPGGTVGASDVLRLKISAYLFNNSGAARGYTVRVKFGGSTVIEATTISNYYGTGSDNRYGTYVVDIYSLGATDSQRVYLDVDQTGNGIGTVSIGDGSGFLTNAARAKLSSGTTALTRDMTANQTLEVSVELSVANANYSFVAESAVLEHVQ